MLPISGSLVAGSSVTPQGPVTGVDGRSPFSGQGTAGGVRLAGS